MNRLRFTMRITVYLSYLLFHLTIVLALRWPPKRAPAPYPAPALSTTISRYFNLTSESKPGYCRGSEVATMVLDTKTLLQTSIRIVNLLLQPSFPHTDNTIAYIRSATVIWGVSYITDGEQISVTKGKDILAIVKGIYSPPYIISCY